MQTLRRIFGFQKTPDASDLKKSGIQCVVQCLDEAKTTIYLPKTCLARELYDRVYKELDFQCEHDYFALQFTDFHSVRHWLDPTKELKRQINKRMPGPPFTFRFSVKFYSSEPDNYLKEELTRYLFVLQLRSDIREGRLACRDEAKAAELAALVIQSEDDDFDPAKHTPSFVSQFKFLPDRQQTEAFELRVLEEYSKLANRNLSPALCERMYLSKVKNLENYGVDMHTVSGKDGRTYRLGLTPTGILVYDRDEKIGLFFWPRIIKIEFNRSKLKIVVTEDDNQGAQQDHVFVFNLTDTRSCKHLWRCAVEHHSFFRLVETRAPPTKAKQLLRMRSRFYHSFRTESGLVRERQFGTSQRRSARFERRPSTRHSARPSFARADAERRFARAQERQEAKLATLERVKAEEDGFRFNPYRGFYHEKAALSSPATVGPPSQTYQNFQKPLPQQQFRQESERIQTTAMVSPLPRDSSTVETVTPITAPAGPPASIGHAARKSSDGQAKPEAAPAGLVSSSRRSSSGSSSSSSSSSSKSINDKESSHSESSSDSDGELKNKKLPVPALPESKTTVSAPNSAVRPVCQPQSASAVERHPQSAKAAFQFDSWSPTPLAAVAAAPAAAPDVVEGGLVSEHRSGVLQSGASESPDPGFDTNGARASSESVASSSSSSSSSKSSANASPAQPPPALTPRRPSGIRPPAPVPGFVAKEAAPVPGFVAKQPAPVPGFVAKEAAPVPGFVAKQPAPVPGSVAKQPAPVPGSVAKASIPVPGWASTGPNPVPGLVAKAAASPPTPVARKSVSAAASRIPVIASTQPVVAGAVAEAKPSAAGSGRSSSSSGLPRPSGIPTPPQFQLPPANWVASDSDDRHKINRRPGKPHAGPNVATNSSVVSGSTSSSYSKQTAHAHSRSIGMSTLL